MTLATKLVIVIRDDLPAAWAANAAAVLALSLGGRLPHPPAADAKDGSGELHAGLNPHPVPILSATADQLRDLHRIARADGDLITVGFNEVARQARTYDGYVTALAATPADEIDYVAVAAYGPRNRISALTKRLPLYAAEASVTAQPDNTHRRAGLFPTVDDRRFTTPANGSERQMLHDMLRAQRNTLTLKCSDIEESLARRAVPPSTLSLLGLIRHLADVERRWFRQVLAGQHAPPQFSSQTNPDGDFDDAVPEPAVIAAAHRAWHDEVTFADTFIANAPDLDIEGHDTWRGTVSLRWVLIHLIEEYARHNGHADLLRERIDGTIGM
ncbi:mycothiol transferase [Micromonospora sp. LZ34]